MTLSLIKVNDSDIIFSGKFFDKERKYLKDVSDN